MSIAEEARHETHAPGAADRLRLEFGACKLAFSWLGNSKTLSKAQKEQAASTFGAEGKSLTAGKKLLNKGLPVYQRVTTLKTEIGKVWKSMTLPYTEPGIRLIPQRDVDEFNVKMNAFRYLLQEAVRELDYSLESMKDEARSRLRELYNASDYPTSFRDEFSFEWEFPSIEPPEYLMARPEIYAQQSAAIAARFTLAAERAEGEFIEGLATLVDQIGGMLTPDDNGKPREFKDYAVRNLRTFFERFSRLNVGSSDQLARAVEEAGQAIAGLDPRTIQHGNEHGRRPLASAMAGIGANLDQLIQARGLRRIVRPAATDRE